MTVVTMAASSLAPTRAHHEGGCVLAVGNSHDLTAAVGHGTAEGLAQEAPHVRGGVGGMPGDFGNHCVCEAAGVGLHDFNADHVPALHEVVVAGHDGTLMPGWGGGGGGREGGEDERNVHLGVD